MACGTDLIRQRFEKAVERLGMNGSGSRSCLKRGASDRICFDCCECKFLGRSALVQLRQMLFDGGHVRVGFSQLAQGHSQIV